MENKPYALFIIIFLTQHVWGQKITIEVTGSPIYKPNKNPLSLQLRNCDQELGMESGDISDDDLTVSSTVSGRNYGSEHARLNGESAWVTHALPNQWIQIDLAKVMYVSGIRTQSNAVSTYGNHLWIISYKVLYKTSKRQQTWNVITQEYRGGIKVFLGNTDATSIKTNLLQTRIQAQVVRIVPMSWSKNTRYLALRMELLGCNIAGDSGCGTPRVMTNPVGFMSSMNYPGEYDNNANCKWVLTAPSDKVVILEFVGEFSIESDQKGCNLDFVEIIDVIGKVKRSFGRFCGSSPPVSHTSTYNMMEVHFLTDHFERNFTGFRAKYTFVNGSGCGGPQSLLGKTGYFQSMNFPKPYNRFSRCKWDIKGNSGEIVEIVFIEMQIHGSLNNCNDDILQIKEYVAGSNGKLVPNLKRFCGNETPPKILSETNHLQVTFHSRSLTTDKGFRAHYEVVPGSGCEGKRDLNDLSGTIHSLNFPNQYPGNAHCEWNILANPNQDIKIKFLSFDLEDDVDCKYDHVSIYDGTSLHYLLGKYCNNQTIQPLIAHSGAMKIIFKTDQYNHNAGFNASYVIVPRRNPSTSSLTHVPTPGNRQGSRASFVKTTATKSHTKVSTTTKKISTTTSSKSVLKNLPKDEQNTSFVTKELGQWIVIGLISVGSLLIITIFVALFLCCKHQVANRRSSVQDSLRNGSSGAMQNHAYDISVASTTQSVHSRQLDAAESSQISENKSHQGTLSNDRNRDSHIYFSIDDYCSKKTNSTPPGNKKVQPAANIKCHFTTHPRQSVDLPDQDELIAGIISEDDDEYDYEESRDYNGDEALVNDRSLKSIVNGNGANISTNRRASAGSENTRKKRRMVANILYEPANNSEKVEGE